MAKESRPNTYNRIVDASLMLFNTEGERNISTNHIASYLSISPGNLYYHFRNKDEIIMQLFKRYSVELLGYLREAELPRDTSTMKTYMVGVYDVMWKYRFLFSDVNTLLARSAELLGEHNDFTRAKVSPLLNKLLEELTAIGLIQTDAVARHELALNMWLITKYWFDFDSSLHEHQLTEASKYRGIHQTLSLLRPFVCPPHQADFSAIMTQLVADNPE